VKIVSVMIYNVLSGMLKPNSSQLGRSGRQLASNQSTTKQLRLFL